MTHAEELHAKITDIVSTARIKKSGKQLKWDIYRHIKETGRYYREQAEAERVKAGLNRPSDDEIKIHLMLSMVTKDKFSDAMTVDEYKTHIIKSINMVMNK